MQASGPRHINQRFQCLATRSPADPGSSGPLRPVGCICGLGTNRARGALSLAGARRTDARVPAWSSRGRGSPRAPTSGRGPPAPSDCPRRGRRLRPPHRSGILPTSGRRHSARTSGGPRRPRAGAANSTQGSPSKYNRDGGRRAKPRGLRATSHHQVVLHRVVPNDLQISCRRSTHAPALINASAAWPLRSVAPARSAGPPRPVGCICGLDRGVRRTP